MSNFHHIHLSDGGYNYYFLYNIFCFTLWVLDGSVWGSCDSCVSFSAVSVLSNIWNLTVVSQQKLFEEPRFTWIQCAFYYGCVSCPVGNLRWPIEGITIFFFSPSYRAIYFTLSEKVRARDKVFFNWELYRAITFQRSKIKQVIYKKGALVFRPARNLCAICINSFAKRRPTALYRWWFF